MHHQYELSQKLAPTIFKRKFCMYLRICFAAVINHSKLATKFSLCGCLQLCPHLMHHLHSRTHDDRATRSCGMPFFEQR